MSDNTKETDSTSDTATSSLVKAAEFGISLDHPRLVHTDPNSIGTFLKRYDQYYISVLARASQLTSKTLTSESVTLVALKFCVDIKLL